MLHRLSFFAGDALLLHDHSAVDLRHPVQRRLRLSGCRREEGTAVGGSGEDKIISPVCNVAWRHLKPIVCPGLGSILDTVAEGTRDSAHSCIVILS